MPSLYYTSATVLLALSSSLQVFASPVAKEQLLKRQYGSVPMSAATSTVTVSAAAHPLVLYSLQPWAAGETALSYDATPTASTVTGNPGCYGLATGSSCTLAVRRAFRTQSPVPVLDARQAGTTASPTTATDGASTKTCTRITGASPTTTIPSFCQPSAHVNAPAFANGTAAGSLPPLATQTVAAVANKLDCCAECAGVLNCVAWSFVPAYIQEPTPQLPGGFDPWGRGKCEVVYHVGVPGAGGDATADPAQDPAAAAVCPNGRVANLLDVEKSAGPGVYYGGWNQGPCGSAALEWTDGTDPGKGDEASLCGS
ncbi:uncharacterized protein JN550_013679 [Neoarthrinium moseri]|uniref:uncharacterized protein n=1 Tax=Neoarthrinium moseri TaxID=1658444 RepID=UPI001FDBB9A8|nr:uncharacterized protein JN550_013679 [Neoarthrinium moseri]KAI1856712.1 hypothetical protein JN550_013679 [Neoarthrinium moseri]